jgi:predicted amidohydrolase YtcJ
MMRGESDSKSIEGVIMRSKPSFLIATFLLVLGSASLAGQQAADLVLTNGKIVTVDENLPEAEALAVSGDRILAVGSADEIARYVGSSTRVIDLNGRLAIPGLIEGHGHFMGIGNAKMILDLMSVNSWEEIVDMVAEAVRTAQSGEWIQGRGWHQEKWDHTPEPNVEGLPVHYSLSDVSPDNPVVLRHASGHASFVNAKAMELAGLTRDTQAPSGGEIVHTPDGEPTGVLRETAQGLVGGAYSRDQSTRSPEDVAAEAREMARLASEEVLSKGITSFHDAGVGFYTVDFFTQLADEGNLPVRLYVMVRGSFDDMESSLDDYRVIGYANDHLTVRSIKQVVDGALGPHGAWLLQPYTDLPRSSGLPTTPPEQIERVARLAIAHGYQLNTHAIGDRGNREVLDLYERTFDANRGKEDLRWRIEHSQHLSESDIPRFAGLGVIASMQGIHSCSDGPWVYQRLGETRAAQGAYVWKDLWESGAVVTNGTDAPVEDVDPIASFYCSVTRELKDGSVFFPDQKMTREQALQSYTLNNAYAAFEEDIKGSLTPGKLADITVLSKDIMTIPVDEIPTTRVVYTIVGGEVLYEGR